ncbi:hypothetical protein FB451DRAFT_58630 [Mycena latifolia]|nr:hypothetical protein FB451DRAFT_58630 [Mycena latifolia]
MEPFPQSILVLSSILVYTIYRRWTRISVADIQGPEPESFLLGCLPEFFQSQAAEADFKWQARFGDVVRVRGILGSDRLLISDPKAIQHMYNSGYHIRKQGLRSELTRLFTGPGLAWANNETHRRQRKVNSPAFGTNEARSYVPIFAAYASKVRGPHPIFFSSPTLGAALCQVERDLSRRWIRRGQHPALVFSIFPRRYRRSCLRLPVQRDRQRKQPTRGGPFQRHSDVFRTEQNSDIHCRVLRAFACQATPALLGLCAPQWSPEQPTRNPHRRWSREGPRRRQGRGACRGQRETRHHEFVGQG